MPFITASSNRKIFYQVDSPERASQTLFFIHGLGSSSSFYFSIIPDLRSLGLRSILMDTYGSALSPLSGTDPDGKQDMYSIMEDVLNVLEDLKVREKVILVGHSMGAIVANTFACKYPDLVKGLVLISAVNPSPEVSEVFLQRIESIEKVGSLEDIARKVPLMGTGKTSTPLQHAFIRALILSTSTQGYISLCRVIAEAEQPNYSEIKARVLVLAGENDYAVPLSTSQAMLESYGTDEKDKRLEILNSIGHWPCVESPDDVGKHVGAFAQSFDD